MAVSQVTLADLAATLFVDTVNANSAVTVKGSSGVIYMIQIDNTANAAEAEYVKLYNSPGAVTVGTTEPDVVLLAPANTRYEIAIPEGLTLGTGIQVATTQGAGTGGTTSPTAALIVRIAYT
jgi:hypothetical protein